MISVQRKGQQAILAQLQSNMFPDNAEFSSTHTVVEGRRYFVCFDLACHQHDPKNASYLFIRLLYPGKAISICPEDDIPDIMESLKECAFSSLISMIELTG